MKDCEEQAVTPSGPVTDQPGSTPADVSQGSISFLGFPLSCESEGRKSFPNGGMVSGPGTSTSDSIPARIPVGAFVINADAVELFGVEALEVINAISSTGDGDVDLSNGEFVVTPQAVACFGKEFFDSLCVVGLKRRAGTLTDDEALHHCQLLYRAIYKGLAKDFSVQPCSISTVVTESEGGQPCV